VALGLWLVCGGVLHAAPADPASQALRLQLDMLVSLPEARVAGEPIRALPLVSRFYAQRGYRAAWSLGEAQELADTVARADAEGLSPADYHLTAIHRLMADNRSEETAAQLELLLTDAFLTYGSHLAEGRVDPEQIFPNWNRYPRDIDPLQLLSQALAENAIAATLTSLLPAKNGYLYLRQALARYRDIQRQGGWPELPPGNKLLFGDHSQRIPLLRQRLAITGDLAEMSDSEEYDRELEAAVRHFQARQGLTVDGIVGRHTREELNVPAGQRIRQLVINMERLRWLPREPGDRYVQVNIAAFALTAVAHGEPVLSMRAIVGKPFHTTPVFTGSMSYLVINPYWYVPQKIFRDKLLSMLRRDPGLLERKHIRIYTDWSDAGYEIDRQTIDWRTVDGDSFPYRLRQDPGRDNELGVIKFMFPNKYSVYLHDTPHKALFEESVRNFSHGCVRIEKPMELADFVLNGDPYWNDVRMLEAIDTGEERIVELREPLPVYFLYLTAWADRDGVHFRDDIYERDRKLRAILP